MSILDTSDARNVALGAVLGIVFSQAALNLNQSDPIPEQQGLYSCRDVGGLREAIVADYNLVSRSGPSDSPQNALSIEIFGHSYGDYYTNLPRGANPIRSVHFVSQTELDVPSDAFRSALLEIAHEYCASKREGMPHPVEVMRKGREIHFVNTLQEMFSPGR